MYGIPFPRTNAELHGGRLFGTGEFAAELRWTGTALSRFAAQLGRFELRQSQIERAVILGDYATATAELDAVERDFGRSVFLIQYRLLVAELAEGLEGNARQLSEINTGDSDAFVQLLATFLSMRAERNVSAESYQRKLERDFQDFESHPTLMAYFDTRLNILGLRDNAKLEGALAIESAASVIDRYIQFLAVCRITVAEAPAEAQLLVPWLQKLNDKIESPQLKNLLIYCDPDTDLHRDERTEQVLRVMDEYGSGYYERSAASSLRLLQTEPRDFELYRIHVRSLALLNKAPRDASGTDSFQSQILSSMHSVYVDPRREAAGNEALVKIALSLGDSSLALAIGNFLAEEKLRPSQLPLKTIARLGAPFSNFGLTECYADPQSAMDLVRKFRAVYPESTHLASSEEYYDALITKRAPSFPSLAPLSRRIWAARLARVVGSYSDVTQQLSSLENELAASHSSGAWIVGDELAEGLVVAALRQGRLADAADGAVGSILKKPSVAKKLPLDELIKSIEDRPDVIDANDINVPLLYALADKDPRSVYVAYDNFMVAIGATKPSALIPDAKSFEPRRLTTFLHRVCVPRVLSRSYHFEGTTDLESERLRLCQFLSEFDAQALKAYSAEITAITERTLIRRGMQQIEESKIYVDELGIRGRGRRLFTELFERFRAFADLRMVNPTLKLSDPKALLSYFETDESGQLIEKPIPEGKTPEDITTVLHIGHVSHFRDLFFEVRDRFISSSEHGLDAYLSTRIRHGTLEGHVRSIFEPLHLIAQRDKSSGEYLELPHWDGRLSDETPAVRKKVHQMIGVFSQQIDTIIEHLKRKVVQVSTEKRSDGVWLDFSFSDAEIIQLLTNRFSAALKYDEFMDEVFRVLWRRTETVLEQTRGRISGEIKNDVYDALLNLRQNIRKLVSASAAPELHQNLTQGLTKLQNEFDRIATWFTISHSTAVTEFTMSDLVSICTASINNTYPTRAIAPEVRITNDHKYEGRHFAHFSDIFRTLFDNVIVHSGLPSEELVMKVTVESSDTDLSIRVENSLAPEVFASDPARVLQQRVPTAKTQDTAKALVKTEGGSGVAKIQKILSSDLEREKAEIVFNYTSENRLQVAIDMELQGLLAP